MRIWILFSVSGALACGFAAGALYFGQSAASDDNGAQRGSSEFDAARQENQALREEIGRLESHNEELSAQLFDATRLLTDAAPADSISPSVDEAAVEPPPEGPAENAARGRGRRWGTDRPKFDEAAVAQFGEIFGDLIQAEIDKTQDPTSIDRLRALAEWRVYQDDIRRQIREAGDDPETRAALGQQMREARDASNEILAQEQDRLMAELAKRHGIENAAAFSNEIRAMLTEPLFELGGLFAGSGGPPYLQLDIGGRGRGGGAPGPGAATPPAQ